MTSAVAARRRWPGRLRAACVGVLLPAVSACAVLTATGAVAAPSCDRLVDGGVRDCNLRLGLDAYELVDQTVVELTPKQLELARGQRPLRELDPTPEQFGQIQGYCRSHGEIRRQIGLQRGLCEDAPRK